MKAICTRIWNSKLAWFLVPNDIALALWMMVVFCVAVAFALKGLINLLKHNDFIYKLFDLIAASYF